MYYDFVTCTSQVKQIV